ncbi:MGMT family protein [Mucilaginibacter myungsuensis]|uniref:MGMT family protein n=2 Tax=Mucilaginibacter myungsuensis TaxID=649104 RepID=A0A929PXT3_9SPHI|nr:MGMT family protein [Mucilaginibacter myungsuensis]MBE9663501.1 MGMT family protein [Mucilaginibacter myungsuensis]MDN3600239.1 MGMT family protein [Mucilaginibacter myungsuensis]
MSPDNFYDMVYQVVRLIPAGRVTSYGAIANAIGTRGRTSRMVGYALKHAGSVHPQVPAHRVVNSQGLLTGKFHFGGSTMEQLLASEGVMVTDNKIVDFKKVFWDPATEL